MLAKLCEGSKLHAKTGFTELRAFANVREIAPVVLLEVGYLRGVIAPTNLECRHAVLFLVKI